MIFKHWQKLSQCFFCAQKYGINPLLILFRFVFSINFLEANFLKKGDYHYEEKVYIYHDADVCYTQFCVIPGLCRYRFLW